MESGCVCHVSKAGVLRGDRVEAGGAEAGNCFQGMRSVESSSSRVKAGESVIGASDRS